MASIDTYITAHYQQWVDYASAQVRLSRLYINPREVVNDVLCSLLERDVVKIERLMNAQVNGKSEFDFFIMRIIKISIHSPRSPFRYQRGQHCTGRIEDIERAIPALTSDFDREQAYNAVRQVFDSLEASEISKRIFAWHFFDGTSFSEWPGPESHKFLYESYNRILLIISAAIRKKYAL